MSSMNAVAELNSERSRDDYEGVSECDESS